MNRKVKFFKLNLILFSLLIFSVFVIIFFFLSIYLFFIKDTSESYSLIQSWKEYYSLEDWNLTRHAIADIDGDGQNDMVTFTNCVFLSSVSEDKIVPENRCEEPGMSVIVFQDKNTLVGQKLTSQRPFRYQWLRKSYLVKTQQNIWKFYDINGFQIRVYELGKGKLFHEVRPSAFDITDTFIYQVSHLGITLFLRYLG